MNRGASQCAPKQNKEEMRTIKFRGKRLDGSGWVYGDLIHENNGKVAIKTNLDTWGKNDDTIEPFGEYVLVKPYTVGQYTGMKDRNGKEIYEGDIIGGSNGSINGYEWPFVLQIEWDEEACRFNTPKWRDMDYTHYYNVIGNIHDNPELPEGGKA